MEQYLGLGTENTEDSCFFTGPGTIGNGINPSATNLGSTFGHENFGRETQFSFMGDHLVENTIRVR